MKYSFFDIKKRLSLVIVCGYITSLLVSVFNPKNSTILLSSDFIALYTGSKIISESRSGQLYNLSIQEQTKLSLDGVNPEFMFSYRNPPVVAFVLQPLTFFNAFGAYRIFFVINLCLSLLFLFCLFKRSNLPDYFMILLILYLPFNTALLSNQLSPLLALLYLFIWFNIKEKRDLLVGILSGFLFLKPQHMMLIPFVFILSNKKLDFLKGLVPVMSILFVLSCIVWGGWFVTDYLVFLLRSEAPELGSPVVYGFSLVSLSGLIKTSYYKFSYIVLLGLSFLLYFFICLYYLTLRKKNVSSESLFVISIVFSLCLNPHIMGSDLILLIIPIVYLYVCFRNSGRIRYLLFSALFYLIPLLGIYFYGGITAVVFVFIGLYLLFDKNFIKSTVLSG
ncbi:DUF2029 domain-containing protein [Patescibacteria group bacterium]|nr:DUF2029 domain-containing protein [Patescibacteria group bacterium]